MFRIESYVTPILLSYVDKYVKDFRPADAQVSLWGGGVALHNLVLKADVLQQEVALPFTLVSGRIHELLIQVPWTKIMSEPIVVTIDTIECVLSLNPPTPGDDAAPPDSPSQKPHVVEAPPGYMQALVRRIVSNIALRVHHLIVKYVHDDIVMSLNVKHLAVDSAGADWKPAFADIDQSLPLIRRLVSLDNLTLCLDRADSDGKIRFYQEPLLYRCQLDLRVLTKLVSANSRRAQSLSVQMRSSKLAWGVTSDQLILLLRLIQEKTVVAKPPTPAPRSSTTAQNTPINPSSTSEPARSESWTDWAWSWLPTWIDRDDVEEAPAAPSPIPVNFSAFLDDVSLVFKVMENESNARKRVRPFLELNATHAAIKSYICAPTVTRVHFAARNLIMLSKGKCVCGHLNYDALNDEPTVYLCKFKDSEPEMSWNWPEDQLADVEVATAVDESYRSTPDIQRENKEPRDTETQMSDLGLPEEPNCLNEEQKNDAEDLWTRMAPLVFIEYSLERMPPSPDTNPYDNPPLDFQYSDWVEESMMKVTIKPVELFVCTSLLHRLSVLNSICHELPPTPTPDITLRTLTVEECEALTENLPQMRIQVEILGMRVRLTPWDHSLTERPTPPLLFLDLDLPKSVVVVNGPLYPIRVCTAACQMPEDPSTIWQGARLHVTVNASVSVAISTPTDKQTRPCARAEIKAVAHSLLNSHMFNKKESVLLGYSIKVVEANICGSFARLQAALEVPLSLFKEQFSNALRYTSLSYDALNDEESVAIDFTLEDMVLRGYQTIHILTHILILQSAKATALHDPKNGEVKQAWLFSAPDAPTSSPYLRLAVQWCLKPVSYAYDYVGLWTEPTAVAVDPLFIVWLAYKPIIKTESTPQLHSMKSVSSTHFFIRRKATPPSSSGRGGSKGSGADMIHMRTRSAGSSEKAESRDAKLTSNQENEKPPSLWSSERCFALHERLRHMYVNVELGLTLVYVTMTTASALDCDTIRDAMEWHANASHRVLALSLGRIFVFSSLITKHFWHEINHDGPTLKADKQTDAAIKDGFPWRMRLADISCYTLEVSAADRSNARENADSGLRSQLKSIAIATPRTVLELVTTTVTISVVTKSLQYKTLPKPDLKVKKDPTKAGDSKMKYFKGGLDFKPTTLKEFVRGPAQRKKPTDADDKKGSSPTEPLISTGPLVSIGVNIHADTPPLIFRLEQYQVRVVSAAAHCFTHIATLLRPTTTTYPHYKHSYTSFSGSNRSLRRSVSEMDHGAETPSEESLSESPSELISIYEAKSAIDNEVDVKTFFWFQWVVSRVNVVIATQQVKLAFDIDDIISTVDLQNHYNQLKIKVASASIRYYQKIISGEWLPGSLGGRVLEAREPTNAKEDNHFLSITVTQARISNLPASWKQELHPKLLEEKSAVDSMWEIYATLAPLEAVLQPKVLTHVRSVFHEIAPRSFCPLQTDYSHVLASPSTWQWPFLYINAGGLRLLLTREHESSTKDDTFIFVMGKASVSPHPENPICRRAVNAGSDWTTNPGGLEGRQYEVLVRYVGVRSARFDQLAYEETRVMDNLKAGTGAENPAVKWTQPVVAPTITPVLHSVDIGCVLAPPYFVNNVMICGPAIELNLVSDCALELSLDQLVLASKIAAEMHSTIRNIEEAMLRLADDDRSSICPYAPLLMMHQTADVGTDRLSIVSEGTIDGIEAQPARAASETMRSVAADSGVDSIAPSTLRKIEDASGQAVGLKKSVSIAFIDQHVGDPSEYLEVFVTMGMIEVSLYTADDNSPLAESLRPPDQYQRQATPPNQGPDLQMRDILTKESKHSLSTEDGQATNVDSAPSLTENVRNIDIGKTKLELPFPHARKCEGNLPLLHLTLYQPNLYYWRKKSQKTLQVSLFNAWLGLGVGQYPGQWHEELFSTARGISDPVTDIRPALATMKIVTPSMGLQSASSITSRGTARIDIERPIMVEISTDRLLRLKSIYLLIRDKLWSRSVEPKKSILRDVKKTPFMFKLKRMLLQNSIESITIQMSQIAISGPEGVAGWDTASIQLAAGARPERLLGRALISALVVSMGPPGDTRHVLLQPMVLGFDFNATWEAWRKAEGCIAAREPMIRVSCELDQLTCDIRPVELAAFAGIYAKFIYILNYTVEKEIPVDEEESSTEFDSSSMIYLPNVSTIVFEPRPSIISIDGTEEHYYKDDLRSGAFKLVSGGQLPMAYQVTLHNDAVSWRYPHPRAITRLVAFPLPGQDEETPCVLELYDSQLNCWQRHTYFKIPVGEPIEMVLYVAPPDAVFSVMWRYRAMCTIDNRYRPYEFDINKFMPSADPMHIEHPPEAPPQKCTCSVTAEELSGVVRVDSCFSPQMVPRVRLAMRMSQLAVYLHNEPSATSKSTSLEGYYVSKPLMRSHRMLTFVAKDLTAYAHLVSPAGTLLLLETLLLSDCLDCTTGTLEPLIEEFHLEGGLSLPTEAMMRTRVALSHVYVALHVPRLRTLHALVTDWREAIELNFRKSSNGTSVQKIRSKYRMPGVTAAALEGLVSLWIHNTCAYALRVGQEGTDEVVPLGSGAKLAYRWRCPMTPKKLRFAIASPTTDWHWSDSVPFNAGSHRVRLHESGQSTATLGAYLYIKTEEIGARKCMNLSGRLCLANMLRYHLIYKVRGHSSDENQWRTLCSGELSAETLGKSVICGVDTEMALKIKFASQETGWSGDIPLRECPKENVPWLVKVPRESEQHPYMSVWCRVVRARNDGRILAAIWPLFMLYSHLPLDADVIIESDGAQSLTDLNKDVVTKPTQIVQAAPGRGTCTHLLAPGTTAARHMLTFQYSYIDCPVTNEAVPLHYGVTDTSVFEKRAPVGSIDEVMQETADWLKRSAVDVMSSWPYSIVTKHWPGQWKPALMQPRCDVVVRYQAVRAGGGCSLEVLLCPVVLLCNAAPIALTLRAHDAAPLCKLEPGTAISPPSAILKKPFFISVEMGRETFVSGELSVSGAELGRYGAAPPGRVALDRPAELAIQCNHKVALLTLYYEIKEDINVLGMSSTYVLVNSMDTDISISALAVPSEASKETLLRPTTFKVVEPTIDKSTHGMSLCRFWVWGRWRGSDPDELRLYLFVTLPSLTGIPSSTPIRLGHPPVRRAIALIDEDGNSVPVVVTQIKHEGRWVIRVAHDPCPQLIIHNLTHVPLAVAQPTRTHDDEPGTSKVMVQQECLGTKWFCVIGPDAVTHYSTPQHCMRYPPAPNTPPTHDTIAFLTFAKNRDDADPDWCAPIAATDGEQLLQLNCGITVKLRVRTHPHSTHLELRDVDEHDISASDIRKRLQGAFDSAKIIRSAKLLSDNLERIDATEKLLDPQTKGTERSGRPSSSPKSEPLTPNSADGRRSSPNSLLILTGRDEFHTSRQTFNVDSSIGPDTVFREVSDPEWDETASWSACERIRVIAASVAVALAATSDTRPLVALHLERAALLVRIDARRTKLTISAGDVQIDNLQFESGQFDFGVVASTRAGGSTTDTPETRPPLWNLFAERAFLSKVKEAKMLLKLTYDFWGVLNYNYQELTEIEISIGPLALYIEDLYVTSIAHLLRLVTAHSDAGSDVDVHVDDGQSLQSPLALRLLYIHPLDLTLTLHTAVRMYIALDQSPLRLSAFKLTDAMTSTERLTHALTVHYLSAAILGAGWVVGGLELLGAPGALAARVGGARGGVRGVASAAAAALLRSLSAWAGSLARNLDLLAGDEEHARRAAAARRRPPQSFMAGLAAGITNFAINILGAVGGLAHHPLVGVAVGESDSSATALRRGLLGALAKPLSATADLVAFAGHGLLSQTGWDPVPQPCSRHHGTILSSGWRRDCVRWSFRLAELTAITGFQVLLGSASLNLLITHKFLVVADPDSERIVEMIDFKFCSIGPYQGQIIELFVTQKRQSRILESRAVDEDDEYEISVAAMARVARYTGAEGTSTTGGLESRVLSLLPAPGHSHALHAILTAAVHNNSDSHFPLL